MGIPVASLARVSTAGQAGEDRGGLPRQRAAIEEAVRRHGLEVVAAFELPGVGGDKVSATPAWAEIRAMLVAGSIRGVVCDAVDRLCRASDLDLTVLADLQRHGASIWTPGEVRDLSSETDGLLAGLLALLGGVEKAAITRRAKEGKRALRKKGRWTGGTETLPSGVSYDKATGAWSYNAEAGAVLELARRYAAGESLRSLTGALGIGNCQARTALRHPLYRGRMSDLEGGWITVLDPPLFDDQLSALIDARIAGAMRVYNGQNRRKGKGDPYLLRDVLTCARCGQRIDTVINKKKDAQRGKTYVWRYYQCAGGNRRGDPERRIVRCDAPLMPIADIHEAVTRWLIWAFLGHPTIGAACEALEAEPDDRDAKIERLRARVAELEGQRGRLLKAYMRDIIGEGEFERERAEVERLLSAVTAELRGVEVERASAGHALAAINAVISQVEDAVDGGDIEEIPRLLRAAGAKIDIDRVELDVPRDGEAHVTSRGVVAYPAKRAGFATVLRAASVDVGRAVTSAMRTKSAASPWEAA